VAASLLLLASAALEGNKFYCNPVVAKPHFPWTKIVISSDEKKTVVTQPSRTFRG